MSAQRKPAVAAGRQHPARRQLQVDLPVHLWLQFHSQLLVDDTRPQQWVSAQVKAFLRTPRQRLQPVPYGRVPRDGATRQVGARISADEFRLFRLRLVEVGKPPVSWWLYQRILAYAGSVVVRAREQDRPDADRAAGSEGAAAVRADAHR